MNELDAVLAWVLSIVGGGADCGFCHWLNNLFNNLFNNLLNLGIGVAGAGGAVVGTVVNGASRVGDAARDARDAFNANYDRASGGSGSSTTPPGSPQVQGQFPPVSGPQVQGPFGPVPAPPRVQGPFGPGTGPPSTNPWARAFPGSGIAPPSPTGMPQGTIKYFNVGAPTGSQLGGPQ